MFAFQLCQLEVPCQASAAEAQGNEDLPFWGLTTLSKDVPGVEAEAPFSALLSSFPDFL